MFSPALHHLLFILAVIVCVAFPTLPETTQVEGA
jgi:hypothetical protein